MAKTEKKTDYIETSAEGVKPRLINFEDPRYGKDAKFSDFLGARADGGLERDSEGMVLRDSTEYEDQWQAQKVRILSSHGVQPVDPSALPWDFTRTAEACFTPHDWDFVLGSPDTLMALYTLYNSYSVCRFVEGHRIGGDHHYWLDLKQHSPKPTFVAELSELPLVYCTTAETLKKIVESGKILSDRAKYKALVADGHDPEDLEDHSLFITHTYGDDRRAGLDDYVFTFFGRPPSDESGYGNVQVLLKPDRFYSDPMAFATKDDFMEHVEKSDEDAYRSQVMQGSGGYFLRAAATQLTHDHHMKYGNHSDANISTFLNREIEMTNQYGAVSFSTWEVKVPEFSTDDIAALVFNDLAELKTFQEQHGDRFKLILRPNLPCMSELLRVEAKTDQDRLDRSTPEDIRTAFKKLLTEKPELKLRYFRGADVETDADQIYRLPRNQEIFVENVKRELERGSEERVRFMAAIPDDETTICYARVSYPSEYISSKSDLYLLITSDGIVPDLETARTQQEKRAIHYDSDMGNGPWMFNSMEEGPEKERMKKEARAEALKSRLVKVRVPTSEYQSFNRFNPHKFEYYIIEEQIEIEGPEHVYDRYHGQAWRY